MPIPCRSCWCRISTGSTPRWAASARIATTTRISGSTRNFMAGGWAAPVPWLSMFPPAHSPGSRILSPAFTPPTTRNTIAASPSSIHSPPGSPPLTLPVALSVGTRSPSCAWLGTGKVKCGFISTIRTTIQVRIGATVRWSRPTGQENALARPHCHSRPSPLVSISSTKTECARLLSSVPGRTFWSALRRRRAAPGPLDATKSVAKPLHASPRPGQAEPLQHNKTMPQRGSALGIRGEIPPLAVGLAAVGLLLRRVSICHDWPEQSRRNDLGRMRPSPEACRSITGCLGTGLAQARVTKQSTQRAGEGIDIVGRHQQASRLRHRVGCGPCNCANNGQRMSQRLIEYDAIPFVSGCKSKKARLAIQRVEPRLRNLAGQTQACREPEFLAQVMQAAGGVGFMRAPDDHRLPVEIGDLGKGAHQDVMPLTPRE